jgi:hypothetical protein
MCSRKKTNYTGIRRGPLFSTEREISNTTRIMSCIEVQFSCAKTPRLTRPEKIGLKLLLKTEFTILVKLIVVS